jgi:hypothetical protein
MKIWIILLLGIAACTTPLKWEKNRQKKREACQQEQRSAWSQVFSQSRKNSSNFEIVLYPLDSFSWNSQEGFKGKAQSIYWRGLQVNSTKEKDSTYSSEMSRTATSSKQADKNKKQERSRRVLLWLIISIVGILLLLFLQLRLRKKLF